MIFCEFREKTAPVLLHGGGVCCRGALPVAEVLSRDFYVVLLEVLADKRLTITTAIADGMSTHEYPNIKSKLGKDIYCFFFTGFSMLSWERQAPDGKSGLQSSPEDPCRTRSGCCTRMPHGRTGKLRITA